MQSDVSDVAIRKLVHTEILAFLASAGKVDLGTIYRTLAELVPDANSSIIATTLSAMMREKQIAIQSKPLGKDGAVTGVVFLMTGLGLSSVDRSPGSII
jgi:hypothetical protein